VRGFDSFGRCEARTHELSPSGEAGKIVERNTAYKDDVIELCQKPVQFDWNSPRSRANAKIPDRIVRMMIVSFYAGRDEGCQDGISFGRGDGTVDTRRENNVDLMSCGAVGDQAADQQIYDLSGTDLSGRIRYDNKYTLRGLDNVFEPRGIGRSIQSIAYFGIGKRTAVIIGSEQLKA
jgi:hypothetical protein